MYRVEIDILFIITSGNVAGTNRVVISRTEPVIDILSGDILLYITRQNVSSTVPRQCDALRHLFVYLEIWPVRLLNYTGALLTINGLFTCPFRYALCIV